MSSTSGRTGVVRRRRTTFVTMVVAAFVVPVAIAYACNPQAHVALDKTSYQPGSAITVHGSYFPGNAAVLGQRSERLASVSRRLAGGGFTTTLTRAVDAGQLHDHGIASNRRLRGGVVLGRRSGSGSRRSSAEHSCRLRASRGNGEERTRIQDAERRPQRGPGLRGADEPARAFRWQHGHQRWQQRR